MGVLFAMFLITVGLLVALPGGNLISGLWLVFIGWFLMSTARSSSMQTVLQGALGAIRADEVMNREPPTVRATESVAALIAGPILHQGHRYLIVDEPGEPVGLITLHEIKRVPIERRASTHAADIMLPAERVASVSPDTDLWEVLRRMGRDNVNQVPVVAGHRLLGVVSREQLVAVIQNQTELAGPG
jgi:CBS domain-containing protein